MEGYRRCASTNSSCIEMSVKDPLSLLSVVTDAPWQIIDKTKKKENKIEATCIQSGFVAAKGSIHQIPFANGWGL